MACVFLWKPPRVINIIILHTYITLSLFSPNIPFIFQLLGCAILGVGIWVRVDPNFEEYVKGSDTFNYLYVGAYILIVVGLVIMVIGFLGCCGAIRESQCMLSVVSGTTLVV